VIKEAIQKIEQLVVEAQDNKLFKLGDRDYTTENMMPIVPPRASAIGISSLTGLIDWYEKEMRSRDDVIIHVKNEGTIRVSREPDALWKDREYFAEVSPLPYNDFSFNIFQTIETTIIELQSKFVETPERNKVIDFISKITANEVVTAEDDGTAQKVVAKNEIGRLDQQKFSPIVKLKPYRTFREVDQPESRFLLRLKQQEKSLPIVALFEADGGEWRNVAVQNIAKFLRQNDRMRALDAVVVA
jgi:hypothetical protein